MSAAKELMSLMYCWFIVLLVTSYLTVERLKNVVLCVCVSHTFSQFHHVVMVVHIRAFLFTLNDSIQPTQHFFGLLCSFASKHQNTPLHCNCNISNTRFAILNRFLQKSNILLISFLPNSLQCYFDSHLNFFTFSNLRKNLYAEYLNGQDTSKHILLLF